MSIESWGWDAQWQSLVPDSRDLFPGRIVFESRQMYKVAADRGENWGILTGSMRNRLESRSDYPAVGDWLLARSEDQSEHWLIDAVLPRRSAFSRHGAGAVTEAQVIAANCDTVFTVFSLDGGRNFNLRGLERYLTCAWDSGASPAIVLNKADLCDDVEGSILQAQSVSAGAPVFAVSCLTGAGFEALDAYLIPGQTIAMIGRSGVGKSSIINHLSGEELMKTGELREQDHRGRHTTTHREIVMLPGGALLIDTPGLRELQLWGDESTLESAFADIESLAESCRFRDCSHTGEPGCGVQEALGDGSLDQERFENYLDLQKELRHLKRKQDVRLQLEEQKRWKSITKQYRKHKGRPG